MMDAALHGWSGIALAYAAVQGPMIAGLIRARANFYQYAISPIAALPLMAVAAVGSALFPGYGAAHAVLTCGPRAPGLVMRAAACLHKARQPPRYISAVH